MNWVGGSRSRLVMRNDAKKQREFFEKRKMQNRLKNFGISLPTSPRGTSSGSLDLVTLFIVNQIAAKKENKDPPKVGVLGSRKGGSKQSRDEPLVLPMSPCSPSQLSFVESRPQYSVQGTRQRGLKVIPQGFKYQQLSPVQESAFSDVSASDYLPPITDPTSPFSSTSSASSGQGMFPLQMNLQQRTQMQAQIPPRCSPPPWDTSGLEQTEFQPFSQPRGMTDSIPWSCASNPPFYQLATPTAPPQVLFGGAEPYDAEARDHARHEVTFSLNQPEGSEPALDFTLSQSETEQQTEDDIFRGFSAGEAPHFGRGKLKIYLKDETAVKSSTPPTVPDPPCRVELSNRTDMNFSRLEHNSGPVSGCDCSPSFSCGRGYLSSDSDDEEEEDCCKLSLHTDSLYMDQACCADTLNPNLGSQGNPKQRHSQPMLLSPPPNPKTNFRDDQKTMENVARADTASGNNTAQFDSPKTQTSEACQCKRTHTETRDAGTQTVGKPAATTCDASTQCGFAFDSPARAPGLSLCLPPVDVSGQHPATGRQTYTAAEPNTHTPSPGETRSGGERHTPWSKKKCRADSFSGSKVILQGPINPFLAERGQQENGHLMEDLSTEVREEVTPVERVSRHSEEAKTLQEIADILLMFRQREK